ncbi:MAG: alpha/beta hydrolase [Microthrixaceae bacterium]
MSESREPIREFPPLPEPNWVQSTSGVLLATYDLGLPQKKQTSTQLLFAHATGFCAGVWAPLTQLLPENRNFSIDFRGHGLSGIPAVGMNWAGTAEDLLATIDHFGLEQPFGVGHSMGGAALILAEQMRPGTFSGLWVYEPIIFPSGGTDVPSHPGEVSNFSDKNPLVASALRRRDCFESRAAAEQNFANKFPLSDLCEASLGAYVTYGFEQLPDGSVKLRCRPEIEADTYRMGIHHDAFAHLGEVKCPVTVARGDADFAGPAELAPLIAHALPHATLEDFAGLGHFGPLQDPHRISVALLSAIAAVTAAT